VKKGLRSLNLVRTLIILTEKRKLDVFGIQNSYVS